jgi:hypothetical protein
MAGTSGERAVALAASPGAKRTPSVRDSKEILGKEAPPAFLREAKPKRSVETVHFEAIIHH